MNSFFTCPLCGKPLEREPQLYRCPSGHCFDRAREGYVNLLPPNQRHSKAPGDDPNMAAARTRFLDGGWYAPLRDSLCALVELYAPEGAALLDAGCGEGWYTQALSVSIAQKGGRVAGVDLSKPAVKKAARRCPDDEFAVASVYHLPTADNSTDLLVDCFAPLAAAEFARVLRPGGVFLYVVPGPRHLWELKQVLYDTPYENDEKQELYPGFLYLDVTPVEFHFTLPNQACIRDLLHMTPYVWRTPPAGVAQLETLDQLELTGQFRVHCMRRV